MIRVPMYMPLSSRENFSVTNAAEGAHAQFALDQRPTARRKSSDQTDIRAVGALSLKHLTNRLKSQYVHVQKKRFHLLHASEQGRGR